MPPRYGVPSDEESALLSGSGNTNQHGGGGGRNKRTRAERGVTFNRVLIYLLIIALVLTNIRTRRKFNDVKEQLRSSQQRIEGIENTLQGHDEVIHRFNSSITNADVIARMSLLEKTMNDTAIYLSDQLEFTKREVSKQLNNTIQELSDTVTLAEQEISDEVEKVKKDVEHYVVTTQDQFSLENSFMVYQLAGTFTLLSCLISMWHMTAHLRKMNQPDVQRKILAILWMSPIYAVTSWFSLVFHSAEGYLAIIKDGYEAYIIYQFLSFCISVIGRGDRDVVVDVLARHADHLTPPFRLFGCFEMCGCCKPSPYINNRALADAILLQCQGFAMQFVLFRPLTTTAMVVLKNCEYYGNGDGPTDYRAPQFYVTIIQNLSIFVAFTGLLKFYHAVDKELQWCRPLAKFLCIKGVVFMTFWQGLCISVLAQTTDVAGNDKEEWAMSAQNFLICLEMLLFSIAHFYCFPTEEWQEGYRLKAERSAFGDTIALGDFFQDVKLILTSGGKTGNDQHSTKSKRRRRKSTVANSSRSVVSQDSAGSPHQRSERKGWGKSSRMGSSKKIVATASKNTSGAPNEPSEEFMVDLEQPALSLDNLSKDDKERTAESSQAAAYDLEQPPESAKQVLADIKAKKAAQTTGHVQARTETGKLQSKDDPNGKVESDNGLSDQLEGADVESGDVAGEVGRFIDENIHEEDEFDDASFESDRDDDDDDGYTDTTMEDMNDEQQFVKRALMRSLGSAGNDPDIKEATKRLLESKVLSPEFFLGNEASIEFPESFPSADDISGDDDDDDDDDEAVAGDDEAESTVGGYEDGEDDSKEEEYHDVLDTSRGNKEVCGGSDGKEVGTKKEEDDNSDEADGDVGMWVEDEGDAAVAEDQEEISTNKVNDQKEVAVTHQNADHADPKQGITEGTNASETKTSNNGATMKTSIRQGSSQPNLPANPTLVDRELVHESKRGNNEDEQDDRKLYQRPPQQIRPPEKIPANEHNLRPSFFTTVAQIGESTQSQDDSGDDYDD